MLGHIDMLSAHNVTLLGFGMVKTPFLNKIFGRMLPFQSRVYTTTQPAPDVLGRNRK